MVTKVDHVQTFFEQPQKYLSRRDYEIRLRAETVKESASNSGDMRILDIGCGDGSISLPLLTDTTRLTLLDLSSSMLAIARSKVPSEFAENVVTINQNFMTAEFQPQSMDLILCIGVLAHVPSPEEFLSKIVSLLKPGGTIIVECTDSDHILTRMIVLFTRFWSLFRPTTYPLNKVSSSDVTNILARHHLKPTATLRFAAAIPGIYRIFSQATLYKLTRQIFGKMGANRNAWLGNEYIGLFTMQQ
jgi:ubiquinone/menaquinone biosynthesis C-methylase UbiE